MVFPFQCSWARTIFPRCYLPQAYSKFKMFNFQIISAFVWFSIHTLDSFSTYNPSNIFARPECSKCVVTECPQLSKLPMLQRTYEG